MTNKKYLKSMTAPDGSLFAPLDLIDLPLKAIAFFPDLSTPFVDLLLLQSML
jgi:hypothetical protein